MKGGYILIVEDNELDSFVLKTVISSYSTEQREIHVTNDGLEALKVIEKAGYPSMAFIDKLLPYFNGFDVIEMIRDKCPDNEKPLFILITAELTESDIVRAKEMNIECIEKPIEIKQLLTYLAYL